LQISQFENPHADLFMALEQQNGAIISQQKTGEMW